MTDQSGKTELPQPDPDTIVEVPVDQLLLDSENARLSWRTDGDSQFELLKILWTQMSVDEVALSIAENGFFRSEPLFVVIENEDTVRPDRRKYTVIEGNRRLAAVMLLRNADLRQKVGATDLPMLDPSKIKELAKLPVIIYPDRQSLWPTVGFRHINGTRPWDSFSKAKYIADVHDGFHLSLEKIAETVGDRHATVARLYRGYEILKQADVKGRFSREDRANSRFYFSHLYTAVDQKEYQDFLGITPEGSLGPNPVPDSHMEQLEELLVWLYGSRSRNKFPVVRTQSPDLNTLREILSKPESLAALRGGEPLERAYSVFIGDRRRFRDALVNAKLQLQDAKGTVTTGYKGEDDMGATMEDILDIAQTISREMRAVARSMKPAKRPSTGREN